MITDTKGNKYYKLGLHVHTTRSDGHRTPEEAAQIYRNAGYDAIAFTDHWVYGGEGEIEGLKILSGCEYNLGISDTVEGVMHIVGIGMRSNPCIEKGSSRQEVIDKINASGGIAVLAHPAWSLNTVDDYKALDGVAATEIYNAVSEVGESMRAYSDYFVDLSANAGMFPTLLATDDTHYYTGEQCRGWVMVNAKSLEDEDLLDAIRRGALFATQGPMLFVSKEGSKITVDTTPCQVIGIHSNKSWSQGRVLRGDGITHFEYETDDERWLRVECVDRDGKRAWSCIILP